MHTLSGTTLSTPIGPFMLLVGDDGVYAAGFTDRAELLLPQIGKRHTTFTVQFVRDLSEHARAVQAYFEGDIAAIDTIPVVQYGSPFLLAAWKELRTIPAGDPISYRELAARLGNVAAARAAGTACGRNPVALIVPCHRVLRSDGSLGGYGWGLPIKRWLLAHEAAARDDHAARRVLQEATR
jgi:methylated-DNA-[protein]-cysteine S-methyltransferase